MELKYLEMLNQEQLRAVKIKDNCVVSAGAGSGKTRVLAKRFVYMLIERNIPIEKIAALTFTKKAAMEMRERIYGELLEVKNFLNDKDKITLVEKALDNFSNANISTIDSFCSVIARNGCRQFGISPDFNIDQSAANELIARTAFNFFLECRNDKTIISLIGNSRIDTFVDDLLVAFLKLTTVTKMIDIEKTKKIFDIRLLEIFKKEIDLYLHHAANILKADDEIKGDAKILAAQNILNEIENVPNNLCDDCLDEFCKKVYEFKNISLKGGQPKDDRKINVRASIKYIRDTFTNQIELIKNTFDNRDTNFKIFDLFDALQKEVVIQKRTQGVFTYLDVAQLALDSLLYDIDLRNFYKNEYDAIMIDEFQDNNMLQRDLLFLLSEKKELHSKTIPIATELTEDKLFFVGDDKQSIYLFRGADVSVFKKLNDEFTTDETIALDTNYRSEKNLIHFFNFAFANVFYSSEHKLDSDYEYATTVEHLAHEASFIPIRAKKETQNVKPSVDVYTCDDFSSLISDDIENFLDKHETEAFIIAQKISQMVKDKIQVRDNETNAARPCRYSDFAILFKSTTHQTTIERFLRRAGVPYHSAQQRGIFYDAPINDLLAWIQLALHPDDKESFAQVLRSPFVSIGDEAFTKLLLHDGEKKSFEAFTLESADLLSDEERQKFFAAYELFLRVKKYIAENNCAEIISKLWYEEGYRSLLLHNLDYQRYLELYDYIFEIARLADENSCSIESFLIQVRAYISNEDKLDDMDIPVSCIGESKNAVNLLTIHKSKGLEFPIVCIPFCANGENKTKLESKIFYSEKYGLSINIESNEKNNANIFYNEIVEFEKFKKRAELKRLLYVALTRAENHIIMTGIKSRTAQDSFYALLNEVINNENMFDESMKDIVHLTEIKPIRKDEAYFIDEDGAITIEKKYDKSFLQLSPKNFSAAEKKFLTASHLADDDFKDEYFTFDGESIDKKNFDVSEDETENISAADIGTLTHAAIEARFHNTVIDLPKREEAKILRWCDNFFHSEIGLLATNAKFLKTEYGFITRFKGANVVGKVDLLFRISDILYIIDYKTDTIENPDRHREQLSVYKKACVSLFKVEEKNVKALVFYLRSGRAVEV